MGSKFFGILPRPEQRLPRLAREWYHEAPGTRLCKADDPNLWWVAPWACEGQPWHIDQFGEFLEDSFERDKVTSLHLIIVFQWWHLMAYVTKISQNNSKPFKTSTMCCEICHCQKKNMPCRRDARLSLQVINRVVFKERAGGWWSWQFWTVSHRPHFSECCHEGNHSSWGAWMETAFKTVWMETRQMSEAMFRCSKDSEGGKQWITVPNYPNNFCMEPWFFKGVDGPLGPEMPGPNSRNWNALVALWHLSASFAECTTSIAGALFDACVNSHLLWFHASWNRLRWRRWNHTRERSKLGETKLSWHRVWIIEVLYFLWLFLTWGILFPPNFQWFSTHWWWCSCFARRYPLIIRSSPWPDMAKNDGRAPTSKIPSSLGKSGWLRWGPPHVFQFFGTSFVHHFHFKTTFRNTFFSLRPRWSHKVVMWFWSLVWFLRSHMAPCFVSQARFFWKKFVRHRGMLTWPPGRCF